MQICFFLSWPSHSRIFRLASVMLIMMPCSPFIRREIYKKTFPAQDAAEAGDLAKVRTLLSKNVLCRLQISNK
jgi:hypothetical protein